MEGWALLIVSVLLLVAVVSIAATCVILGLALSKVDDRKVLSKTIKDMTDALVLDKEDQIHRIRTREEAELGLAHIRAQTTVHTNSRFVPVSDNGKADRDSVHVDLEE